MLFDQSIKHGLGELGFVAFVVPMATVTEHVHEHVALELLAEGNGEFDGKSHRFGIVAVHMEYRTADGIGNGGAVIRRACIIEVGGKADLVVDDEM